MEKIIVTDITSELSTQLIKEKNIYVINSLKAKSPLGLVTYEIDSMVSSGFDVVYLSSHKGYSVISSICEKISEVHPTSNITVVDIESSKIYGKNNLVLRLLKNDNLFININTYQVEADIIKEDAFLSSPLAA